MYRLSTYTEGLWAQFGSKSFWSQAPNVDISSLSKPLWAMFSNAWTTGVPTPELGTEWANLLLEEMEALPEIKGLHRRVEQDPWATSVAHGVLLDALGQEMPEHSGVVKSESVMRLQLDGIQALSDEGVVVSTAFSTYEHSLNLLRGEAASLRSKVQASLPSLRNALREACEVAREEMDRLTTLEGACGRGWGKGPSGGFSAADIIQRQRLADLVSKNDKINRVLALAGRMLRVAARVQASKVDAKVGEIVGVQFGDDLESILPEEMSRMVTSAESEAIFWVDFVEKGLMNYRCTERAPMAQGPVIYLVDESGSMLGDREEWARAIAIVLASLCREQGRDLLIASFDTDIVWHRFAPLGVLDDEHIEWLGRYSSGGGTSYEPALDWAVEQVENDAYSMAKADIVMVTDDECAVKEEWLNEWKERKQDANFPHLIGLGINCSVEVLSMICDGVHEVDTLDAVSAAGAFSI